MQVATDLISREKAIDLAYDCEDEFGKDVAFRFAHYLKQLPSAQPERETELISREEALHAITSYNGVVDKSVAKRLLIQLPSAEPERKPGKWEIYVISMFDGEGCRCSECGFEGAPYWGFCPGCGADMRGEQDDQRKSD